MPLDRSPRRPALLLGAVLVATALSGTPARAQPSNDAFAAAERLPGETTVTTSNVGATKEPGEPEHAGNSGGASIWFSYVAPETGSVTLDTRDSAIDTVLAVYTGQTVSALSLVAFDDDGSGLTSRLSFQAQSGARYRIAIDGKDGVTGSIVLHLTTNLPRCDVLGTAGGETLRGAPASEGICGLGGNDKLVGGGGDDALVGGPGSDWLEGGPGDDVIEGGEGQDTAAYSDSPAVVVDMSRRRVTGEGTDELNDIEVVVGSPRGDRFTGGGGPDIFFGDNGDDRLDGAGGDDVLMAGAGNDRLESGPGNDLFAGDAGNDSITFASSPKGVSVDLAFGGALAEGTDEIKNTIEEVTGTRKSDVLRGGKGADRLVGGGGADTLSGLGGRDVLDGGAAGDLIWGGEDNDRITGGTGSDACHPGTGGANRRACERTPPYDDWLGVVNLYRSISRLPRVMEDPDFSAGDRLHARYVVKTDQGGHFEDPNNRWYTKAGAIAAGTSNVQWSSNVSTSDAQAISYWMTGPYHAHGILNPSLDVVGFGSYREAGNPGYTEAAALDIIRGLGLPSDDYPVMWPGPNSSVPLTTYTGGEQPDPLARCSGYSAPTGLPLLFIENESLNLGAHSLRRGSSAVAHCAYKLNDATIVVIPRSPLSRGSRYTVTVNAGGEKHVWGFRVR